MSPRQLSRLGERLYRGIATRLRGSGDRGQRSGEQGAGFYDRTFQEDESWRCHYTASPYYFLWTVILDRIRRAGCRSVLEVGCGTGQLAHAIQEARILDRYCGFDFSEARVRQARRNCPGYRFEADAFRTDLYETCAYDVVIATEFLEHVERDLDVIRAIRPATRFIGTVPNFPFVSHVRHFEDCEGVARRYGPVLTELSVAASGGTNRGRPSSCWKA